MSAQLIGYARCSTDEQDLTAQRDRLTDLGVAVERIYLDHGLTGTTRLPDDTDRAGPAVSHGPRLVVAAQPVQCLAQLGPSAAGAGDSGGLRPPTIACEEANS